LPDRPPTRSGPARRGASRPGATAPPDAARRVAYELQRAISADGAYANLALPKLIAEWKLSGRDAALATELGYGTARAAGTLDEIIAAGSDRPVHKIDAPVRDLLRLGAYQLLRTRIPAHAAVASTVELARTTGNTRSSGFLNAVLRRITANDWAGWVKQLAADATPIRALALQYAHPEWIAQAFADALGGDLAETERALAADDERPQTHLVAYPGRTERAALLTATGGTPGPWSPYAVRLDGGDPGRLDAIRDGTAGVQDEGSQLCAIALAAAELAEPDLRWLDLCAGPGGKAALLAALAQPRGVTLTANEVRPHRAELVARATRHWPVQLLVEDARTMAAPPGGYDRVLLDAPCSGLGALRRRPEARWRRTPADLAELVSLQRELLVAALRLVRPGGLVAYVTCSPHLAETRDVVAGHDLVDARPLFAGLPDLGAGPTVQLWPHRQGTDAMFFALVRRADEPAPVPLDPGSGASA
jgi:16S rRNA (cytosine967-C5)-methyltransferase